MPLPPLPDAATVGGPGHISDSQMLEAYLKALAAQDAIPIDVLPDPAPGEAGHIAWHNAVVAGTKKVADAIGATVNLPPLGVKAGDKAHTAHHNLITKALNDAGAAVPFTVTGGEVKEIDGWTFNYWQDAGASQMVVKGKGSLQVLCLGGGGGAGGFFTETTDGQIYFQYGGAGGGGGMDTVNSRADVPTLAVTAGTYEVKVGAGGVNSDFPNPGTNGKPSSIVGGDLSITGLGGGGGGGGRSGNMNASAGGCGGAPGYWFRKPDPAGSGGQPGKGSQGFDGAPFASEQSHGNGGSMTNNESWSDARGWTGSQSKNPAWFTFLSSFGWADYGVGVAVSSDARNNDVPGMGGLFNQPAANWPANAGLVVVAYKAGI